MALATTELILLLVTIVVVVVDVILALCLRFVLPNYVTTPGWYHADGSQKSFDQAASICQCLHRVYPEGTDKKIKFETVSYDHRSKRSVKNNSSLAKIQKYPFLVSLSSPREKVFACSGLIQTTTWVLTTKNCVQNDSEWYNLTVRSGSPFWTKYGTEHSITEFYINDFGLVMLKVVPHFSESLVPSPPITISSNVSWTYGVSLGWTYTSFDVEEWTSIPCGPNLVKKKCTRKAVKFLLTSCHQLIAMSCGREDEGFSFLVPVHSIYKDICGSTEVEICS